MKNNEVSRLPFPTMRTLDWGIQCLCGFQAPVTMLL